MQNSKVENKVQSAVDELNNVNIALKAEVKEREVIEQELEEVKIEKDIATEASLHDSLTGLPNRALFHDRLGHGLEQAKRHEWNLAVMFLDLDKFKQINDEYGHHIGDKVLLAIANRLKQNTRSDDTLPNLVVKLSIGISLFPKNADNLDDLIKLADEAMYAAKQSKLGYVFA